MRNGHYKSVFLVCAGSASGIGLVRYMGVRLTYAVPDTDLARVINYYCLLAVISTASLGKVMFSQGWAP